MARHPLKRLLVVEDELDIRAVAKLALEAIGHFTVRLCSSGGGAVRETRQHPRATLAIALDLAV